MSDREPAQTGTQTQPRPNISTENPATGSDRAPSDTLDRDRPAPDEHEPRKSSLTGPD